MSLGNQTELLISRRGQSKRGQWRNCSRRSSAPQVSAGSLSAEPQRPVDVVAVVVVEISLAFRRIDFSLADMSPVRVENIVFVQLDDCNPPSGAAHLCKCV